MIDGRVDPDPPQPEPVRSIGDRLADGAAVGWLTLLAGLIAAWDVFFLPLRAGGFPVPLAALVGGAAMIVLPRICFTLSGRIGVAALPALLWWLVTGFLCLVPNPVAAVPVMVQDWRLPLLLGIGALGTAVSYGLVLGDRLRADPSRSGHATPGRGGRGLVPAPKAVGDTEQRPGRRAADCRNARNKRGELP